MSRVIIQGSARADGHTHQIVQQLAKNINADIIDLLDYNINHYDYQHRHQGDDFLPLIRVIAEKYDTIIFATPVYWYSMSGLMKVFFDRMSDCLQIEKETGRKFRGKKMAAICCGSEPEPTEAFFVPFRLTAEYMGMDYLGDLHTWIDEGIDQSIKPALLEFANKLNSNC